MSRIYYFSLPKITCINCVNPVLNRLDDLKKTFPIEAVAEDIDDKTIAITVSDSTSLTEQEVTNKLKEEISSTGVKCVELGSAEKISLLPGLIKGLVGVSIGAAIMILMMMGVGIPALIMFGLMSVSTALTLYLGAESYNDAAQSLIKSRELTMDTLFSVSSLTVVAVSIASFFVPGLPMMMDAGLMIFGFRHLGKVIEESLKQKVLSGLKFKNRALTKVKKLKENGEYEETEVDSLQVDDVILVPAKKIIPVDGECLDDVNFYDTDITGATLPHRLQRGSNVLAGMKVLNDVRIKVKQTADNSYLAQLDKTILQTSSEKSSIEKTTKKILQYFIPTVIGVAVVSGILVGTLINPALAIPLACTLLVSACPCTLGFIIPRAIKIAITKANELGIKFKSGKTIEAAADVDTVIFDLNGTLTTGIPIISPPHIVNNKIKTNEFLDLIATIEASSPHPIAHAIVEYVKQKNITHHSLCDVSEIDASNHCGISATWNQERVIIGSKKMMDENNIDVTKLQINKNQAEHIVYIAKGGELLGYLLAHDPLRDDAKQAIESLQNNGMKVCICSGGDASFYAKKLGLPSENVFSNCAPTPHLGSFSKIDVISRLQAQGHIVAMIGDSGNDSAAITKANFGMAVASPSANLISQQQAGAVIRNTNLQAIVTAFTIAKDTVKHIKENLAISLIYNSGLMILGGIAIGVGFALNPGIGVALMVLQASILLLNQYRLSRKSYALQTIQRQTDTPSPSEASSSSYQYMFEYGLKFDKQKRNEAVKKPVEIELDEIKYDSHRFTPSVEPSNRMVLAR